MRHGLRALLGVTLIVSSSACYHATITTGLPAGTDMVTKEWAIGWLWGLIPPDAIETASKCKNGVAKVETQHSFLNGLAMYVTGGIFTPMQIDVTCASSNRMGLGPTEPGTIRAKDGSIEARKAAMAEAIGTSLQKHEAVFVQF